jgi:hypothetical protein
MPLLIPGKERKSGRRRVWVALATVLLCLGIGAFAVTQNFVFSLGDDIYYAGGYVTEQVDSPGECFHFIGGEHGEEIWGARVGRYTYSVMRTRVQKLEW